jgi:hypothetical protein
MVGDRGHRSPRRRRDLARAGAFEPMLSECIDRDIEESPLNHASPISSFERTINPEMKGRVEFRSHPPEISRSSADELQ